ncbi:tyrosine-type recombinase/integrase [Aquisalimonas lutea]|uniref:tyrosine-type recombinase/integrase n=1 Tax=Aquisalimonas lutea TaxID=1327750 RepID=UPI0025B46346|nr:tyrosine-type recombinase/integrase [Aquisalimonas lutea]MDN3519785.1 tyrosine-type recombinase/integrase [Aquisalimonas lutea]
MIKGNGPRTRYVEDWEIDELAKVTPRRKRGSIRMIQAYIALKLMTGLRRKDLLSLKVTDMRDDGLHVVTSKTNKPMIFERTKALEHCFETALAARPVDIGPYVFCNRRGDCYLRADGRAEGWNSMWRRFMDRVLTETQVSERFTDHDLRGKAASDAESLERAQQLLGHADPVTTQRAYRRGPAFIPVKD